MKYNLFLSVSNFFSFLDEIFVAQECLFILDDYLFCLKKVRKSMCRIKHVLTERAIEEPDPRRSAEMKRMINFL